MNKKSLTIVAFLLLIISIFFLWRKTTTKSNTTTKFEQLIDTPKNKQLNDFNGKPKSEIIDDKSTLRQNLDTTPKQNNFSFSDWKEYKDETIGISFQFPKTWVKQGQISKSINREGTTISMIVNFIDTITSTSLFIEYHLPPYGIEIYKNSKEEFYTRTNKNSGESKQIIQIAGTKAFQSISTMSSDIKGNIYEPPLRIIQIIFLDKLNKGAIRLRFKTAMPKSEYEISKFKKTLSTFKFIT